jgi:Ca2+-binding EF-hand superfamily protein
MVRELNLKFKLQIQQRGGNSVRNLKRIFTQMDLNGNKKLDSSEFEQALAAFGIFPKKVELQALMKYYDVDQDGFINYQEFMSGLKDELSERRVKMVRKAFEMLDKDGSGKVTVSDIESIYDVSKHPEFLERRKSKQEILGEFLNQFDGVRGNNDGTVTWEEFVDYYSDMSMSIPSDEYFVRMMESTWQVAEDEEGEVAKQTVKNLYAEVRQRVQQLSKNDPVLLKKIFSDFDLSGNETLTIDEMSNLIAKLKISVERKYIYPFFKIVDRNNSGTIEFDEFEAYVLSN